MALSSRPQNAPAGPTSAVSEKTYLGRCGGRPFEMASPSSSLRASPNPDLHNKPCAGRSRIKPTRFNARARSTSTAVDR